MCSSANYSYFVGLAAMDTDKSPVEEVLIFGIEVFSWTEASRFPPPYAFLMRDLRVPLGS